MDLFELIKKHYGRQELTDAVETAAKVTPPPPELPALGPAIYLLIDEVDRLRTDNAQYKDLFQKEVVDVMNGEEELDKLKTRHWAGLRKDPYHNDPCMTSWGYTSRCPTCRVIKYADETRDALAKAQEDFGEMKDRASIHLLNWKQLREYLQESVELAQKGLAADHTNPCLRDWVHAFIRDTAGMLETGKLPAEPERPHDE